MAETGDQWNPVDVWWEEYVQDQERDLIELRELLEDLNRLWKRSDCLFDEDPLVSDWTETSPQAGPLRTNQEENWSQWLAHLLRGSSGEFTAGFFGPAFHMSPTYVRCERAFHDDELHDRRVDILAEFANRGLSIEVKIGDEHYEKTPQTAYLTEKHYRRELDWDHYLLLPESKRTALQAAFGDQLEDGETDRQRISASGSKRREITVTYWSDVARALRGTLLAGSNSSPHWTASGYLFTTLIEQQILQFYALPSLEEYHSTTLGISDVERLQSIDPEEQITYLTSVLEENAHG